MGVWGDTPNVVSPRQFHLFYSHKMIHLDGRHIIYHKKHFPFTDYQTRFLLKKCHKFSLINIFDSADLPCHDPLSSSARTSGFNGSRSPFSCDARYYPRLFLSRAVPYLPQLSGSLNGWSRGKSLRFNLRPIRFSRQPMHRHPHRVPCLLLSTPRHERYRVPIHRVEMLVNALAVMPAVAHHDNCDLHFDSGKQTGSSVDTTINTIMAFGHQAF
jgi:hypothetical protein